MITKQNVKSTAFVARLVANTHRKVGFAFSAYTPEVHCRFENLVEIAKAVGKVPVFSGVNEYSGEKYFSFVYEGVRFFALKDKEEDKKQ